MAQVLIRNSLNSSKAVAVDVTLKQFATTESKGDLLWLLEVGTTHTDSGGYNIRPVLTHLRALDTLDDEIEKAVSAIADQIDWEVLMEDKDAPYILSFSPSGQEVSIYVFVEFNIKESLPSAGIDLSNMKVTINNGMTTFDITGEVEVTGDPYEYRFVWAPPERVLDTYA